jgi:hypothetical protein
MLRLLLPSCWHISWLILRPFDPEHRQEGLQRSTSQKIELLITTAEITSQVNQVGWLVFRLRSEPRDFRRLSQLTRWMNFNWQQHQEVVKRNCTSEVKGQIRLSAQGNNMKHIQSSFSTTKIKNEVAGILPFVNIGLRVRWGGISFLYSVKVFCSKRRMSELTRIVNWDVNRGLKYWIGICDDSSLLLWK